MYREKKSARWGLCGSLFLIIAFLALSVWAILSRSQTPPLTFSPPPAAMAVELAPEPIVANSPLLERPLGPRTLTRPEPSRSRPKVFAPPSPAKIPPVPTPKRDPSRPYKRQALSRKTPALNPPPFDAKLSAKETTPPKSLVGAENHSASIKKGAPSQRNAAQASQTWQSRLLAQLEKNKYYPEEALADSQEGTVLIKISINRQGRVLAAMLVRKSAFNLLNAEAIALAHRASPLPPPPDDIAGTVISLTVPVEFYMNRP